MAAHYTDLILWQKAMDLTVSIYELTEHFPRHELFGLVTMIRRTTVNIPCQIAEGQGRGKGQDFFVSLKKVRGTIQELETLVYLARRLGYLDADATTQTIERIAEVGKLNTGLMNALRNSMPE